MVEEIGNLMVNRIKIKDSKIGVPDEYDGMIDLIANALNDKLKLVGNSKRYDFNEIQKIAVEKLVTSDADIEILGRKFKFKDLISESLQGLERDCDEIVSQSFAEENVKKCLFNTIIKSKHIFAVKNEDMHIDYYYLSGHNIEKVDIDQKHFFINDYKFIDEDKSYILRNKINEEYNRLSEKSDNHINDYLDYIFMVEDILKIKILDYDEFRNDLRQKLLLDDVFDKLLALKLKDQYQYCLILNRISEVADEYIDYFNKYREESAKLQLEINKQL
ncbi:MAG: hypothetical protein Q4F66_08905 [Clostridium sp.]|nr:hypothetical protein [Clostridium sp.]